MDLPSILLSPAMHEYITDICIDHQVEGLRADILLMKAARAHTAFQKRKEVTHEDVKAVMNFVIAHRSKKNNAMHKNPVSNNGQQPREEKEEDTAHLLIHSTRQRTQKSMPAD